MDWPSFVDPSSSEDSIGLEKTQPFLLIVIIKENCQILMALGFHQRMLALAGPWSVQEVSEGSVYTEASIVYPVPGTQQATLGRNGRCGLGALKLSMGTGGYRSAMSHWKVTTLFSTVQNLPNTRANTWEPLLLAKYKAQSLLVEVQFRGEKGSGAVTYIPHSDYHRMPIGISTISKHTGLWHTCQKDTNQTCRPLLSEAPPLTTLLGHSSGMA